MGAAVKTHKPSIIGGDAPLVKKDVESEGAVWNARRVSATMGIRARR